MELFDMFQGALCFCDNRLNLQLTADISFVGLTRIYGSTSQSLKCFNDSMVFLGNINIH